MILPKSKNKKYIEVVIGIYITFVIINPIVTNILKKEINFDAVLAEYIIPDVEANRTDPNTQIEKTYVQSLENSIKEEIEKNGYKVRDIYVDIDTSSNNYGQINKVYLEVSKEEKINEIKQVEIDISKNKKAENSLSRTQETEIIDILSNNYNVDKNNIIIGGNDD